MRVTQADAVLHFGTHGSLEFMPGKQVGMSDICYPDSLIGSIPNLYYYAANNPSEATIAKRRSYANTISYLTPPAENAGLYKGLKVRQAFVTLCTCCPLVRMANILTNFSRFERNHSRCSSSSMPAFPHSSLFLVVHCVAGTPARWLSLSHHV